MTQQGFWQVQGNVLVDGKAVLSAQGLVIDTGTTLIVAPQASVDTLFAAIPSARQSAGGNGYEFPCADSINVALSFDGSDTAFAIPPAFLSLGQSPSDVSPLDPPEAWRRRARLTKCSVLVLHRLDRRRQHWNQRLDRRTSLAPTALPR